MIERIQEALKQEGVSVWRIEKTREERAELYFIKKELDQPRFADITRYTVTVFRDFEENGTNYRGQTTANVAPGMTDEEIRQKIRDAYFGAAFVKNPFFQIADPIEEDFKASASDLSRLPLQDIAAAFAQAMLDVPSDENAFINSMEIFMRRCKTEIAASNGLHVSFGTDRVSGEFVTQCKSPEDVEQYRQFSYDSFNLEGVKRKIAEGIEDVRLRAGAKGAPKSGTCSVILKGEQVGELLSYYLMRSAAAIIYPHYSDWKPGDTVQEAAAGYETLDLTLTATEPYSDEGIPMKDRRLIEGGVLKTLHGGTRFCRYLGIEPTGDYRKLSCANGSMSYEDMRKGRVIECVSFSDFQTDFFTGNFGGEIRLSLLHEDGKTVPLSGGSINGKLADVASRLVFSTERYEDENYAGPYAVLIPDVPIAGQ